jgi:uncharacterized damage-inducible protein DinB
MTSPTGSPPLGPVRTVTGGEREVLESFLDFHRAVLVRKVAGVPDADARHRLVRSETTLAGLLRHLALVEENWFQRVLAGAAPPRTGDDDSWELRPGDTVAELTAAYEAECARSRETAARFTLDDTGTHPDLGTVSLRWIYVHLTEETARHVGHADILRELTDGATGALG